MRRTGWFQVWAESTAEGQRAVWERQKTWQIDFALTRLAPLLPIVFGLATGLPMMAVLGLAAAILVAVVVWSERRESRLDGQIEAEFQAWMKHQGSPEPDS